MSSYLPLNRDNAADYLRQQGWIGPHETVAVEPLSGGVSNEVLYVSRLSPSQPAQPQLQSPLPDFVLKQALPQLRTPQPWFSSVERIWREVEVMRICQELLDAAGPLAGQARTPRILYEDRANYTFAMSAAPREHHVWKADLLAGRVDFGVAEQCGRLLGVLHAFSWGDERVRERIGDRRLFDELRLDPYYRTVAAVHPADAPLFDRLIANVWDHPLSLVHADFTPKNLLVWDAGLMMVDFETGHFGDPAFDLGLFLAHLVLKAAYHGQPGGGELASSEQARAESDRSESARHESSESESAQNRPSGRYLELVRVFWETYRLVLCSRISADDLRDLETRGVAQLAGCVWARLDGKSRVDYLTDDSRRSLLRTWCRQTLIDPVPTFADALLRLPRF
jgi:aminoglycoside phosphotransferase (APT) family kinase protein